MQPAYLILLVRWIWRGSPRISVDLLSDPAAILLIMIPILMSILPILLRILLPILHSDPDADLPPPISSRSLPADLPADLYHCVKSLRPDRHPFGLIESLRSVSPEDSPANRLCLAVGSGFLLGPSSSLVIKRQKTSENCAKLNEFQSLPFPSRYLPLVRYTFASRSIGSSINSPCSEGQLILLGACIVRAYSSEYVKFRRTSVLPNERSA